MSVPVHSEEPEVDIEADLPLEGNFVEQAEYFHRAQCRPPG